MNSEFAAMARPRPPAPLIAPLLAATQALATSGALGVWLGRDAQAAYLGAPAMAHEDLKIAVLPAAAGHEAASDDAPNLPDITGIDWQRAWPPHHRRWLARLATGVGAQDVWTQVHDDTPQRTLWIPGPAELATLEILEADEQTGPRVAALLGGIDGDIAGFVNVADGLLGALAADWAAGMVAELQWQTMMQRYRDGSEAH